MKNITYYEAIPIVTNHVYNAKEAIMLHNSAVREKNRTDFIWDAKSIFDTFAENDISLKTIKSDHDYFMVKNGEIIGYYKWQIWDIIDYVAIVEMIKNIK